jgi:hypothetical protein
VLRCSGSVPAALTLLVRPLPAPVLTLQLLHDVALLHLRQACAVPQRHLHGRRQHGALLGLAGGPAAEPGQVGQLGAGGLRDGGGRLLDRQRGVHLQGSGRVQLMSCLCVRMGSWVGVAAGAGRLRQEACRRSNFHQRPPEAGTPAVEPHLLLSWRSVLPGGLPMWLLSVASMAAASAPAGRRTATAPVVLVLVLRLRRLCLLLLVQGRNALGVAGRAMQQRRADGLRHEHVFRCCREGASAVPVRGQW